MYVNKKLLARINAPMMSIFVVLVFAVSGLAAIGASKPAGAVDPAVYNNYLASRDGCYSSLNSISLLAGAFNPALSLGMVNAIVNVPVYDWDQPTANSASYTAMNLGVKGGLRGAMGGNVVGYAQDFNFKTVPIPNAYWMQQYFTKQAAYDGAQLVSIATGQRNPFDTPGFGTRANPHIANPFIFQQAAMLNSGGLPTLPMLAGDGLGGNWWTSMDLGNLLGTFRRIFSAGNDFLNQNGDTINSIGTGNATLNDLISNMVNTGTGTATTAAANLVNIPPFSGMARQYNVNGNVPADNCRETNNSTARSVPSYAFSVVSSDGVPIMPFTLPGSLYGAITLVMERQWSMSGATIYPRSINGKEMLDCYGRGGQPMIAAEGRKFRSYIGQLNTVNGWIASAAFAIELSGIFGNPMAPAATALLNSPAIGIKWETYFNGFAFAFALTQTDTAGKTYPAVNSLPTELRNRVVDYSQSKSFDINTKVLTKVNGTHADSQNGAQFNPDIYVRLKEPYVLEPNITFEDNPATGRDRGDLDKTKEISVNIDTTKHGFDKEDGRYEEKTSRNGGPTYDNNDGAKNTSAFSKASVYRIEMKPGVIPNAIDAGKVVENGPQVYKSGNAPATSGDVCGFFQNKLATGDTATGQASALTPGSNANDGRDEWSQENAYNCQFAKDSTGNDIHDREVRMQEGDNTSNLLKVNEKIPAETPPGTKICYAVFYDAYTNDSKFAGAEWWTGSKKKNKYYDAPAIGASQFLTKANCIVSGYKPSMQVRGGDLMVTDGGAYGGVNRKDFLAGSDTDRVRSYGSWGEYGVIATGNVRGFGSGSIYRTGAKSQPVQFNDMGYMTFSNKWNTGGGSGSTGDVAGDTNDYSGNEQYGHYTNDRLDDGFTRVARQFTEMNSESADLERKGGGGNTVDLYSLRRTDTAESGDAKVYVLNDGVTNITSSQPNLGEKQSIIVLVPSGATVNIAKNIEVPTQYASVDNLSQVVFAPATAGAEFTININHNVSRVDAWLINPGGNINTCKVAGLNAAGDKVDGTPTHDEEIQKVPRSKGWCDNTLNVNGPVSAGRLILRRNGGKDQSSDPTRLDQSIAAENFNLRSDAYLWSINLSNNSNRKFITTNSIDLPPRY